MPRYFFHIHDRLGVMKDDEGMELASMDEAKAEALQSARDNIAQTKHLGPIGLDRVIEVKNSGGETVWTLKFQDAVLRDADTT